MDLTVDTDDANVNLMDVEPEPIDSTNTEGRHLDESELIDMISYL